MLRSILVPLDGSPLAEHILSQVRRILIREEAEVMLLHVLHETSSWLDPKAEKREMDSASACLEEQWRSLSAHGAKVRYDFMTGNPAVQILRFAQSYKPSIIAMSTHGRTGLGRFAHGNVATTVVRHSPFPVLLCAPHGESGSKLPEQSRFRRILVPLDGSAHALFVLPLVEHLARLYDSEVILLHAEAIFIDFSLVPTVPLRPPPEETERILSEPLHWLTAAGIRARPRMVTDPAVTAILSTAVEEQVDLVAMTTHGRSGLSRLVFGSVAEEIVPRCPCPVLVQRTSGFVEVPTEEARAPDLRWQEA